MVHGAYQFYPCALLQSFLVNEDLGELLQLHCSGEISVRLVQRDYALHIGDQARP